MPNPTASDIRVFVPAKDFSESKQFYVALGWKLKWEDPSLAELELADRRFLLQNYYAKDWAENFMFHVTVEDAHAWHEHVSSLLSAGTFSNARVNPPKQESYGALVTYVWDPSGVLLHFAQWASDPERS
jgi:hypothetical protein